MVFQWCKGIAENYGIKVGGVKIIFIVRVEVGYNLYKNLPKHKNSPKLCRNAGVDKCLHLQADILCVLQLIITLLSKI